MFDFGSKLSELGNFSFQLAYSAYELCCLIQPTFFWYLLFQSHNILDTVTVPLKSKGEFLSARLFKILKGEGAE